MSGVTNLQNVNQGFELLSTITSGGVILNDKEFHLLENGFDKLLESSVEGLKVLESRLGLVDDTHLYLVECSLNRTTFEIFLGNEVFLFGRSGIDIDREKMLSKVNPALFAKYKAIESGTGTRLKSNNSKTFCIDSINIVNGTNVIALSTYASIRDANINSSMTFSEITKALDLK